MVSYMAAATVLRAFAISEGTRALYRRLGNRFGTTRRVHSVLPQYYSIRAAWLLRMAEKYALLKPGDRVLELGTGWLHWEAVVLRLFYDVEAVLFDVWDSRQLEPLKHYLKQFVAQMLDKGALNPEQQWRIRTLSRAIQRAASFEELYQMLGFYFVVDPSGTLHDFPDACFTAIVSGNVLQHVHKGILPEYIRDVGRLLKPGGYSLHTIDMGDQLSYYSPQSPVKNYLRFSERTWKLLFENRVQYFNRVQRPQWLELFQAAGLELVEEQIVRQEIGPIEVSPQYRGLSKPDLECRVMRVVHRKPWPKPVAMTASRGAAWPYRAPAEAREGRP